MTNSGLTQAQALDRLVAFGPNVLPSAKPRTIFQQLASVLREPMLLLLLAAGSISFTLREPLEASILMMSVLLVIGISLYQTRKTDQALAALKSLVAPRATVIRDGQTMKISSEELVVGDLIVLHEGDRVPADAKLNEVTNLLIDESVMTGESFSIEKQVGQLALSGTLVVKGHGQAEVTAIGLQTEIGKIGKVLFKPSNKRTNLQAEVDRLVLRIAILSIVSAIAVALIFGFTRGTWLEGSLAGIATAMSLLPEELPIILTVFFGLGAWRMSKVQVIVRNSPAIELLGQVSVLCVDKTGTITKNEMALVVENEDIALYGLLASPQNPFDPMDKAFQLAGRISDDWKLIREYPVSEKQLAICQAWQKPDGTILLAAKGAPETIAQFCSFDEGQEAELLSRVNISAESGFRVLGVAKHNLPTGTSLPESPIDLNFEFVGLALLSDPVRPGVDQAVATMRQAGVRTIMITGDYPVTAVSIAKEIGIVNPTSVLTGPELAKLTDVELEKIIDGISVYSRMLPDQKLRLVNALRNKSQVVAMTGDGVNDAPALKAANVGIAMGARGSEVAREAAEIVITDDSFISIANGISEGRRIFSNLRRAAAYVIAIHVPIFGMAFLPVLSSAWPLILLPVQIAILELIIDPAASLAYENESLSPAEMKKPPRKRTDRLINRNLILLSVIQGLFLFIGAASVFLWSISSDFSDNKTRALTFAVILLGNLFLMLSNRSLTASIFEVVFQRKNPRVYLIIAIGLSFLVLIFTVAPIRDAFRFAPIEISNWVIVVLASLLCVLWAESYKAFNRHQIRLSKR